MRARPLLAAWLALSAVFAFLPDAARAGFVSSTVEVNGAAASFLAPLELNSGTPVIAYNFEFPAGSGTVELRLATCTANCATASPTWQIVTVPFGGYPSVASTAGKPALSYFSGATIYYAL